MSRAFPPRQAFVLEVATMFTLWLCSSQASMAAPATNVPMELQVAEFVRSTGTKEVSIFLFVVDASPENPALIVSRHSADMLTQPLTPLPVSESGFALVALVSGTGLDHERLAARGEESLSSTTAFPGAIPGDGALRQRLLERLGAGLTAAVTPPASVVGVRSVSWTAGDLASVRVGLTTKRLVEFSSPGGRYRLTLTLQQPVAPR